MQAYVPNAALLQLAENLEYAVLEWLAPDEADRGVGQGLSDEMLAAAEADLDPDLPHRWTKKRSEAIRSGLRQINRPARQLPAHQQGLARTWLAATSPS